MYSKNGIKRLRENHVLFAFIDQYFSKDQYAFEPNMEDGRFVFLPENVSQQGIGLTASKELPGWLEVMFFWYPGEYTEKSLPIGCAQCSVSSFTSQPGDRLADMIREIYINTKLEPWGQCCIFAFNIDVIVRLNGNYMDHMDTTKRVIREALKFSEDKMRRNGEGLITFMETQMRLAKD